MRKSLERGAHMAKGKKHCRSKMKQNGRSQRWLRKSPEERAALIAPSIT